MAVESRNKSVHECKSNAHEKDNSINKCMLDNYNVRAKVTKSFAADNSELHIDELLANSTLTEDPSHSPPHNMITPHFHPVV